VVPADESPGDRASPCLSCEAVVSLSVGARAQGAEGTVARADSAAVTPCPGAVCDRRRAAPHPHPGGPRLPRGAGEVVFATQAGSTLSPLRARGEKSTQPPTLLQEIRTVLRLHHYSIHTDANRGSEG
jgi:hypothetical protein